MQTILGAGGAIGKVLAEELRNYTDKVRLVSRHPQKIHKEDEIFAADLLKKNLVTEAVKGSDIVYLTAGLTYNIDVWKKDWPVIMKNVISACLLHKVKLVFFDNVYMYATDEIPHMTEKSSMQPESNKGKVRKELIRLIYDAIRQDGLQALIARSADFYGRDVATGFLNIGVFNPFKKGKKAFWQADAHKVHSFTYVPDAAKAVAFLGNSSQAYGEVWHLPTSAEKWNGADFIQYIAKEMNVQPRYYILQKWMLTMLGIFSKDLRELKEMQYQYDRDYFFDSKKIEQTFSLKPTPYKIAIREILKDSSGYELR